MRTKAVWFVGVLLLLLGIAGLYFYTESSRFALVKHGEDLYKIDKRTGRTWELMGTVFVEMADLAERKKHAKPETPEEQAIRLARTYGANPTGDPSMDFIIKETLRGTKGPLRVDGWNAKKVDDQTYIVSYLYDNGPNTQSRGWLFEVNLQVEIIRPVIGDPDLEKHAWAASQKNASTDGTPANGRVSREPR